MNNFVYCDECHLVFFDVSCKKCPQCREGNLLEVAVYLEPAAEQKRVLDVMPCGHPQSAVVQADEGTAWCSMCEKSA